MISRALLFPRSSYLAGRWWHRFATVIFWVWLAAIAIFLFKALILDPFSSCMGVKYALPGEPSDLNCGSNAFDYAWINATAESLSSILLTAAFLPVIFQLHGVRYSASLANGVLGTRAEGLISV
ncbi:hypothetical protein [Nitrospira sp. BLG_2]|uniref:hypothetical protein n=1 Tax=Nitrospira sp. BLG_2 TaxID=3397507 RepID=UPI003B9D4C40